MTWRDKARRSELKEKALEIVGRAGKPVSIDYVAYHLKTTWHTARSLLMELAAEGRIEMIETTKSFIFTLPERSRAEVKA